MVLFGRHLVGFFLFLGLTIYTLVHMPTVVDPDTLERWQSGVIMESLPSYLQLPEALSSCVPGTFDGTHCIQVGYCKPCSVKLNNFRFSCQ